MFTISEECFGCSKPEDCATCKTYLEFIKKGDSMKKENYEKILDEIQHLRERNNKNWMGYVRLAFKYSPDDAKRITSDIFNCDAKMSILAKKLVDMK